MAAAEKHQVVACAGELVGQMAGRRRVVRGDDRVRPVRGDVMHEQAAEVRLLIDNHDLDAHRQELSRASAPPYNRQLKGDDLGAGGRRFFTRLLRRVITPCFEFVEILRRHIACNVFA